MRVKNHTSKCMMAAPYGKNKHVMLFQKIFPLETIPLFPSQIS